MLYASEKAMEQAVQAVQAMGGAGFMNDAPVSRIMVRQIQSRANAGTFTNGMPMTSSMGCGVWGGNITNENISLKHYMNVTWVSRPIAEDRPSDAELFGEFYNSEIFEPLARTH